MARVRVYIASSLDGFIAGPDGDLSWLPEPPEGSGDDFGWDAFISTIGCILMGRGTYDAVAAMGIDWPHPTRPTLVATHRPLAGAPPGVSAASGTIRELVAQAAASAGDRDVYLDGGDLVRQALDAKLIDEIVMTLCPVVLGAGHALFAGARQRHPLTLEGQLELPGGLVQLTYRPAPPGSPRA